MKYFENIQPFKLEVERDRIRDVLDILDTIEYGFVSTIDGKKITDREWIHNNDLHNCYKVNTDPEITLHNKLGICQDQAILTKYLMNKYHSEDLVNLYAITKSPKGHCMACYCHDNKWYYIENSWDKEKGLHGPFDSKQELINYLRFIYFENHKEDTPEASEVKIMNYSCPLIEATRNQLNAKSRTADLYKNKSYGTNRFERKKYSKVINQTKSYNKIDMNDLFKRDILTLEIPIQGETNTYTVSIQMEGVIAELAKSIKNNHNFFEYKNVLQSLTKVFNTENIKVKCNCLDKNTLIKLLDGTACTVEEMKSRFDAGEKLYVYSVDNKGDFKPGEVENVWITGKTKKMIRVTLDNGKEVLTTPNHLYMLRTGEFVPADTLTVGQSLMPLYFDETKNGYETVKFNSTSKYHSTYKEVANYYYQNEIAEKEIQAKQEQEAGLDPMYYLVAVHHKDFIKTNNSPDNLQIMTGYEHWLYHANIINRLWEDPVFREENSKRSRQWMTWLNAHPTEAMIAARHNSDLKWNCNKDPEWKTWHDQIVSEKMTKYWANLPEEDKQARANIQSEILKKSWAQGSFNTKAFHEAATKRKEWLTSEECEALAAEGVRKYWANLSDEDKAARMSIVTAKRLATTTPEQRSNTAKKGYYTICKQVLMHLIENKIELTEDNYEQYRKQVNCKAPLLKTLFNSMQEATQYFELNHKIIKIEAVEYESEEPVYDIQVKDFHNFYVDSGIILHNCDDFKYRYAHQLIISNDSVEDSSKDPGPGKTGMANTQGKGCKHILLALDNLNWIMNVASVINNYINYADEHMRAAFLKLIFPKLYMVPADAAEEEKLLPENTDLNKEKSIIKLVNDYSKNKTKYDRQAESTDKDK